MAINRTTDFLGCPAGFSLGPNYAVNYAHDAYGRFHSVTSSIESTSSTYTYGYLPGTDLISGMTTSSGFLWTRAYESGRSLITSVENRFGETVISRYDYVNDELGRRVSRADSGLAFAAQPTYGNPATAPMPAYNAYAYNGRSEVVGATRRWGTPSAPGDQVLGQQYTYEFDGIGNRITAAEGETGRESDYTANSLNQYTQRSVPGKKDLIGTAPTNVAVTVNQNATSRQAAYWHHALDVTNSASAAYPQVEVTGVYNPPSTNDPDVVTSATGHVFVAQTPEVFMYDSDGNLTNDGRFDYTWNGENRLIKAETRDDLPVGVPRVKVEYAYDHQGRMVWKQISTNAVVVSTRTLLWDGYNIIRETINHQPSTTNYYVWGRDLSGTLQGAGGVGGLLAEVKGGVAYTPAFDANGNVTEYLSDDGSLAAHYEYSPFGELVVQSGPKADSFTHRFSTKPWCPVTGLSEYEMRKYGPGMGRWLSRDPISEQGGNNIYVVLSNTAINDRDVLGLQPLEPGYWIGVGTVEINVGDCGAFQWETWFQFGPQRAAPKGGQISQHVMRRYEYDDCCGTTSGNREPVPGNTSDNFWEDFNIPKGQSVTPDGDHDVWHPPAHDGKKGWVLITATAYFLPGKRHQPPGYWPAPEGIATTPFPSQTRTLRVEWNCCLDSKDRTTKLTPMPVVTPGPFSVSALTTGPGEQR